MNIFINDKPAEITLDTEKNLGDVMYGIEQWISPTGNRILGITINGERIRQDHLNEVFSTDIKNIEKLEVFISPWRELAAEALQNLHETCALFKEADFDGRKRIFCEWENSSTARFLASDIPDLYKLTVSSLSGEGLLLSDFTELLEERLIEIANPEHEAGSSETQVRIIAERMQELPLDMQTGKDARAAETISLFSQIVEKLFRIFFIYKSEGYFLETCEIDDLPVQVFMEDFNVSLRELSTAYENNDTILLGDIAEYELAPRLLKFFSALKTFTKSDSQIASEP